MTELTDAALAAWLQDGPESGPPESLARTLAQTRTIRQRPGWLVPDPWPSRRPWPFASPAMAALSVLLIAALLAVTALVASLARPRTPFDNDPIPLSPGLTSELLQQVEGLRFRMDPVPAGAPAPRITAETAAEIADQRFLESLRAHAVPLNDPARPDGVIRRTVTDQQTGAMSFAWVVTYRWETQWDCRDDAGELVLPTTCYGWDTWLVDDQTGTLVTGFSLANSRATAVPTSTVP